MSRVDPAKPPVNRKVENPPAFPRTGSWPPDLKQTHTEDLGVALATSTEPQAGMTLRDYFAAQAMMGFMANSDVPDILRKGFRPDNAAEACYVIADALLQARAPQPSPLPPDFTDNDHDGMG